MSRRTAYLLIIALFAVSCAQQGSEPGTYGPMSEGAEEDQEGRRAWDLERLMDPATGAIPTDIRRKEIAFAKTLPKRSGAKSLTWTARGPVNRGGRTRAFAVDRTDTQRLLAGGVTGGMWLSEDAGLTWQKTTAPGALHSSSCITQDPRAGHDSTWYYGSGENYGVVSGTSFSALLPGDGIFKSTDRGLSWSLLPSTVSGDPQVYTRTGSFKQVNSIVVDPTRNDSDIVLAAVFNGIFRSNDGGATWASVLGLDTAASTSTYTDLRVTTTGVYYAAISNGSPSEGLWRSSDGLTWTEITPTGWSASPGRAVLAIDPSGQDTVWFFANTPSVGVHEHSLWRYTYLSGDGSGAGGAWSNRTAHLPNGTCTGLFNFDFGYINSQDGYDMCIAVDPTFSNVVFIGGTSVYRSTDGWTSSYEWIGGYKCNTVDPKDYVWPDHHPDQHGLVFDPLDPARLYSVNDGGVHVTYDALADSVLWDELNRGYTTSQFYTIHLEEGDATNDLLLGGLQDNGMYVSLTADPADDWARVHQDDGAYGALPAGVPFILTSSQQGRLYKKTVDAAFNITGFERIDPVGGTSNYNFINPFVLDPTDNDRLYWVSGNRIWRNTGLSAIPITNNWYDKDTLNWEQVPGAQTVGLPRISIVDLSHASDQRLMFGTSTTGRIYRMDSLLGATPMRTEVTGSSTVGWPTGYVSCLAPNDLNADEWIATQSNYNIRSIWHTTDAGATWQDVSGNLEEFPDGTGSGPAVFWALIHATWGGEDDRYFVGTSTGLYSTDLLDGANTVWEQEGAATIGNVPVNMIAARNSDGLIAVATHGNGVYSSHLPAAPFSVAEHAGTGALHLWPNPATAELNVELPIADRACTVDIVDAAGRSTLRTTVGRGTARWTWDLRSANGRRVAPGPYSVIVTAGDRGSSGRVVVQ